MPTLDAARTAKTDAFLSKLVRTSDYGVVSYRERIERTLREGGRVCTAEVDDDTTRRRLAEELRRMDFGWNIPWGNECHPTTRAAQVLKDKLAGRITKTEYRLFRSDESDSWSVITKTEYDYARSIGA